VKLNNRNKESTFAPLDDPHERRPAKTPVRGDGLGRDRKARIADMLVALRDAAEVQPPRILTDMIDKILRVVEK
jgi:hypothetical protein